MTLATNRWQIGTLTACVLVVMRLAIGFHFFTEGSKHYSEPGWSSEGFLRQAKGPLAPKYQSVLPDYLRWEALVNAPVEADREPVATTDPAGKDWDAFAKKSAYFPKKKPDENEDADALKEAQATMRRLFAWQAEETAEWEGFLQRFADYHSLTDGQNGTAKKLLDRRKDELRDWLSDNSEALVDHVHQWRRAEKWRADNPGLDKPSKKQREKDADSTAAGAKAVPGVSVDVPFQKKRVADKETTLRGEASAWLSQVKLIERGFHNDLVELLDRDQLARGPLPPDSSNLKRVDTVMTFGILAIGVCLLVGLFTRLAASLGVLFLLSVVATQPFWLADAAPTYNQYLEMLALATLATLPTGRWAGLDFFIHYLFKRPCCSAKGKSDAPDS